MISDKPFNKAPPPVNTIPRSITSAEISGGVSSKVSLTISIISETTSLIASLMSVASIEIVLGKPVTKSRPRISVLPNSLADSAVALPSSIFTDAAVRSQISKLYLLRINEVMASSIASPAERFIRPETIPPREIVATSVVPPPISTTILPVGSFTVDLHQLPQQMVLQLRMHHSLQLVLLHLLLHVFQLLFLHLAHK